MYGGIPEHPNYIFLLAKVGDANTRSHRQSWERFSSGTTAALGRYEGPVFVRDTTTLPTAYSHRLKVTRFSPQA